MMTIFDFTDFREYLRNYYREKKQSNPSFSYQLLTQKAGFNNRGFLFNIIKGTKKLTKTHCYQLSKALGHNRKEADRVYQCQLVLFPPATAIEPIDSGEKGEKLC